MAKKRQPSWWPPSTPEQLAEAELRSAEVERRTELAKRRERHLFGPNGALARFPPDDQPLPLRDILPVIIACNPELALTAVVQRFIASVRTGAFPSAGTGLREDRRRRVVRDLIDLDGRYEFACGSALG